MAERESPDEFVGRLGELGRDRMASLYRACLGGRTFVAVTGSVGKTTTTAIIAHMLSTRARCQTTAAGENQAGQIRAALVRMPLAAASCVVEVSGHPAGTIGRVSRFLRPTVAVVTCIGFDHYSSFRGPEGALAEKGILVRNLARTGVAVLNADDPLVAGLRDVTRARVLTFGTAAHADIRAEDASAVWPDRLAFTLACDGERRHVRTRLVGAHWLTAVLAAVAGAMAAGMAPAECVAALETFEPVFGRCSVHEPIAGVPVVLDTHKAPYWTVPPFLELLRDARVPRRIAVIGSMSDFPGASSARYRTMARVALEHADEVWFVGAQSQYVERLMTPGGRLHVARDVRTFCDTFWQTVRSGDLIGIKATQGDHLERAILSVNGEIACWRTRCGVRYSPCISCSERLAPTSEGRETDAPPLEGDIEVAQQ